LRSILIELKLELPAKKDIDGLVRAVQVPLRLSPGRNDLPAEIEADLRQVLSGLTSVAKGIGALRTHGGRCPQPGDQRQDIGKHLPRYHDFGHLNRHSPETEAVPKEGDSKTAADRVIGRG